MSYTFIIDTNSYSGNFEREMLAFITGMQDMPFESTITDFQELAGPAVVAAEAAGIDFESMVRSQPEEHDGYYNDKRVCILPTPGFLNNGMGVHFKDTPTNRKKYKNRYPAYQSVGIFLSRRPTDSESAFMMERAEAYCKLPNRYTKKSSGIEILGFRLFKETTSVTEEKL